jgi:hypothetical protein
VGACLELLNGFGWPSARGRGQGRLNPGPRITRDTTSRAKIFARGLEWLWTASLPRLVHQQDYPSIRIRRVLSYDVLLLDAAKGVSVQVVGEILAIDLACPPLEFAFEMKIFHNAAPATPAVQTHEAAFDLERVFTTPFKSGDPYPSGAITKTVAP